MRHRWVALGIAVVVAGGVLWLIAPREGSLASSTERRADGAETTDEASGLGGRAGESAWDGGAIGKSIADRRLRDELRRRIFESWSHEEGELARAGRAQRLPPSANSESPFDAAYIQSVMREDMFPMARSCFEELLRRNPKASGRVELVFKIVGDDKLGGIVEEADTDGGLAGALGDERMRTCMTESVLSLSFRPPPKDGWVTVVYPIEFSLRDDDHD